MFKVFSAIFLSIAILGLGAGSAHAHGVWVSKRCDKTCIVLGDGPADNAYNPAMVTKVRGFANDNAPAEVKAVPQSDHVNLDLADNVAIVAIDFDYGYWSNNQAGKFVNKPMNEVPGSTIGTHAVKYNVSYLDPAAAPRAIDGLEMQFIPSVNPAGLKMGDKFEVQLVHNGKPMANTPVIIDVVNDLTGTILTDADGKATITVRNNALNVIGVEVAVPAAEKNGTYTQTKYFASLSFTCFPPDEG